jgi:hypothetical protein
MSEPTSVFAVANDSTLCAAIAVVTLAFAVGFSSSTPAGVGGDTGGGTNGVNGAAGDTGGTGSGTATMANPGTGGANGAANDFDGGSTGAMPGEDGSVVLPVSCSPEPGCGNCIQEPELGERCDNPVEDPGSCTAQCTREYEVLFDDAKVPQFYLTIPASSWNTIAQCDGTPGAVRPPECDYHPATFHAVYDPAPGEDGSQPVTTEEAPVGVRRKGRFTWREMAPPDPSFTGDRVVDRSGKPSLTVKFDFEGGNRFLGLTRLTLNNGRQDPSAIRERLGYKIYAAAGVVAPMANSAELFVKGPDDTDYVRWGLYVNVQSLDKRFIKFHFGEVKGEVGNLYDTNNDQYFTELDRCQSREQGGEAAGAQESRFSLKTNETLGDTSDLSAAIDAVYEPSQFPFTCRDASFNADQLLADIEPELDVDAFLREFAVDAIFANWDGYPGARNNYRLYHELGRDRFILLPWGIDQTFGWQDQVHYPNWHYALDHTQFNRTTSYLMERCTADVPGCRARYLQHVAAALEAFNGMDFDTDLTRMAGQVRDKIDWSEDEFDRHQAFLRQFIETRGACVQNLLDGSACAKLTCTSGGDSCDASPHP